MEDNRILKFILVVIIIVIIIFIIKLLMGKNNSYQEIKLGEVVTKNNSFEFTITSNKVVDKVNPLYGTNTFTYYQSGQNKKYIDIVGTLTNLSNKEINAENFIDSELVINNEKYRTIVAVENEERGDFVENDTIYNSESQIFHIASEIDEDILENNDKAELVIEIENKKYKYEMNIVEKESDVSYEATQDLNINYVGKTIVDSQTISIPNYCDFKIVSYAFSQNITASKGANNYFRAEDGKIYLDLLIDVTNNQNTEVVQNSLLGNVKATYQNKNEFECSKATEENNGTTLNGNTDYYKILSGQTLRYHVLFEMDQEIQNSTDSLYVTFYINGENYIYTIR